jgi:predicted dienelactone hydrolase
VGESPGPEAKEDSMLKSGRSTTIRIGGLILLAGLLTGCAATGPAVDHFAAGPYQVATDDSVTLQDQIYNRDLNVRVRYPVGEGNAKFPLVVFSHGAFCYPQQYANVTDFWVSHGYVVAFPDHLDSPNLGKIDPRSLPILLNSRVNDMSLVLDSVAEIEAAIPGLAGRIDSERLAVAGHSFGGMIAMVKSGLRIKESAQDPEVTFADARFDAAVILSGVGQMEQMTDDAFGGLTGPLIASGGTLDIGNVGTGETYPWEWRMSPYNLAPPGDKYSIWLTGADHYMGGQICRDNRGGEDDPETARVVRTADLAFLDAYVKGDRRAKRWLKRNDWSASSSGRATFATK